MSFQLLTSSPPFDSHTEREPDISTSISALKISDPKLELEPVPELKSALHAKVQPNIELPSTQQSHQPWTFLTHIPLEIRLLIYQFALTSLYHLKVYASSTTTPTSHKALIPALLRTSSRLKAEALPILYGHNAISLTTTWPSLQFLQTIGPTNAALVRMLKLNVGADYDGGRTVNRIHYTGPLWCEVLKRVELDMKGLERFEVCCEGYGTVSGRMGGSGADASFLKALRGVKVKAGGRVVLEACFGVDVVEDLSRRWEEENVIVAVKRGEGKWLWERRRSVGGIVGMSDWDPTSWIRRHF